MPENSHISDPIIDNTQMGLRHFLLAINHPMATKNKLKVVAKYLNVNFRVRLQRNPLIVNWLLGARFYVTRQESGIIGNAYCGLYEYEQMAFLLDTLNSKDIFIDIGANSGIYSIISAKICETTTHSFEPNIQAFNRLKRNMILNNCLERVVLHSEALLDEEGILPFVDDKDTNNFIDIFAAHETVRKVEVRKLDSFGITSEVLFIKIDVEGLDYRVLLGSQFTIKNCEKVALIIETNSLASNFGYDLNLLEELLLKLSFERVFYNPSNHTLRRASKNESYGLNSIYLKGFSYFVERLYSHQRI